MYGVTVPFLFKFPLEDLQHVEDSEYYSPGESVRYPNKTHQMVKRFLKQVRESGGYDVDCIPPLMFGSPFTPLANLEQYRAKHPQAFQERLMKPTLFAIEQINAEEEGRNLGFVDLVKVVTTMAGLMFLTFAVKADASAPLQTLQALVAEAKTKMKTDSNL